MARTKVVTVRPYNPPSLSLKPGKPGKPKGPKRLKCKLYRMFPSIRPKGCRVKERRLPIRVIN